jgi:polyhydroxyalkanoate synthase
MRVASRQEIDLTMAEQASPAIDAILGANPFVGIDARDIFTSIGQFVAAMASRPDRIASRLSQMGADLVNIAMGASNIEADAGDKRFADPAWSENLFYRRLMQTYLAWRSAMHGMTGDESDQADGDWKAPAQQRFAITLLTEALAPTNTLLGNPAALKRAFETGGASLIKGLSNFIDDLINNGGMPSQVDKRPFKVGVNIAATPGAVVHRAPIYELLQYAPAERQVYQRPLLLVPPQINKYYVMDLAPKRSLTEYAVANGIQFFTMSWRNPGPENRAWNFNDYVGAIKEAIGVVCDVTSSPDVNLLGICAGGITSSLLLGHLAASGDRRVNAATLAVTMLDSSEPSMVGMFTQEETVRKARERSEKEGVLDAATLQRTFAWLRPNDLVWHYWINNYLMGNDPAAFDILFWNADSTNLPAALHAGFLDILLRNPLVEPNKLEILGTPINLRNVANDMYLVAGMTDHICAWRACHRASRLLGGHTEFVLNSSGHIQTLVCPPGNFKAKYLVSSRLGGSADAWRQSATEHKGSWWDHWIEWLQKRSGEKRPAPESLGNPRHTVIEPAPGSYVFQRP